MSTRKSQASAWLLAGGLAFSGAVLADDMSGSTTGADSGYSGAADPDSGMSGDTATSDTAGTIGGAVGVDDEEGVTPGAPGISSEPSTGHETESMAGTIDDDAMSRGFESADADGDGQLTEDEFQELSSSQDMAGAAGLGAESFSQLDRDRDGTLSQDEVQAAQ